MPRLFLNYTRYSVFVVLLFCSSCVDNKILVYSDNIYKPIPAVATSTYKSPEQRIGQDSNNAVGISISGGGSRAQYFALGVLIGLDEIKNGDKTFLNEIDYFSTVSGGGFAAGYYLTLEKNYVLQNRTFLDFWKSNDRKIKLQEFLYKSAKASSILNLPRYEKNKIKKPYPTMIDNELLQYGKSYNGKIIDRLYLKDFFVPASSNNIITMPMFVTNGTIYNNGERFPFMPHIINYLKVNGSLLPIELFGSDNGYDLPLAYAITGSAAFPGVLPMLKLSIENEPDSCVRIIDGGAVDNLGFTTLFELLHYDKVNDKNKKALIVDCGGFGSEIQKQDKKKVKIGGLLTKSLLYTVDINLLNSDANIKYLSNYYNLYSENIKRVGFSTIKNKFIEMETIADNSGLQVINSLRVKIKNKNMNWEDLYRDFAQSKIIKSYSVNDLSEIPSSRFKDFSIKDIFELFELSAQIETKIKIYPWEKEILILAGRYAVYLEQEELEKLI